MCPDVCVSAAEITNAANPHAGLAKWLLLANSIPVIGRATRITKSCQV